MAAIVREDFAQEFQFIVDAASGYRADDETCAMLLERLQASFSDWGFSAVVKGNEILVRVVPPLDFITIKLYAAPE